MLRLTDLEKTLFAGLMDGEREVLVRFLSFSSQREAQPDEPETQLLTSIGHVWRMRVAPV
ncbi:hypothetical protein EF888_20135 [Silicimonas algicola]|uniref:Uncharacterized protein n=1 Tax=Silicimonas algicola TaxID=1826607 RepID=A0A316GJG4_9RHOB|nr:hypothetical protein [Silicimonas algicola]AZQ69240.1 hypothetical protein EF888_20135 [Silicimonas algicola]PWK54947.1 hypothetical protein C8D95_10933 [Silicimonas algicola]